MHTMFANCFHQNIIFRYYHEQQCDLTQDEMKIHYVHIVRMFAEVN